MGMRRSASPPQKYGMQHAKICHFLGIAASAILIFIFVHSLISRPMHRRPASCLESAI
jgi:thiosulfate reductase cytochrome b subunit